MRSASASARSSGELDNFFDIFSFSRLRDSERLSFVAYYRGFLTFIIAVVILAVDFRCFPRAFAKTDTYGVSLMDFGVGGVIFMSGVVSYTARGKKSRGVDRNNSGDQDHVWSTQWVQNILDAFTGSTAKLIVLGIARLVSVWGTAYHVPTDEYGVHWNFFFTIAFVSCICSWLEPLLARVVNHRPVLAATIITFFVFCVAAILEVWHSSKLIPVQLPSSTSTVSVLKDGSVWEWMLHGERVDLISANKEGIFSLPGYCCLRLLGTAIGCVVNFCAGAKNKQSSPMLLLAVLMVLSTVALVVCGPSSNFGTGVFAHPSRRLCNFSYIMVTAGLNLFLMASFLVGDIVERILFASTPRIAQDMPPSSLETTGASQIIIAWQKAPLLLFLLANVQTGLVNLFPGLEPLRRPAWVGVCVCCGHAVLLSSLALRLRKYKLF